jgi:hypothetical protein
MDHDAIDVPTKQKRGKVSRKPTASAAVFALEPLVPTDVHYDASVVWSITLSDLHSAWGEVI